MQNEFVNKYRLERYGGWLNELSQLLEEKRIYEEHLSAIKAVDYSKSRVTNGNSKALSSQEIFVAKLQEVNQQIDRLDKKIMEEREIIERQLGRLVNPTYRKILKKRFVEQKSVFQVSYELRLSQFIKEHPGISSSELQAAFYNAHILKYRDEIMRLQRQALSQLERISLTPYIPETSQLTIDA